MALVPFTGAITQATLRANFDDKTSTLTTNALDGQKDHVIFVTKLALDTLDDISTRCVDFTPVDDYELRVLRLTVQDTVAGRSLSGSIVVADGDDTFLLGNTVIATATTTVGTVNTSIDYRTTTGTRLRLLKGVPYRLVINAPSAGPVTRAQLTAVLRSRRRAG